MKHPNNELVFNNLYGLEIISEIIPKIIEWDLFPVQGIGYYQKGDHFGHLELKIYIQENSGSGLIIWSVEEYKIHTDCFDKEISNSIRPRPINRDLIKKLQNHSQK